MEIPLLALLFQGIPESIGSAALAFGLAGLPFKKRRIVVLGLAIAFSAYLIRMFPITFGVHTIFLMGLVFIYLIKVEKCRVLTALIAGLGGEFALVIAETVCMTTLFSLTGFTPEEFLNNTLLRILSGLPQVAILFLLAYLVYRIQSRRDCFAYSQVYQTEEMSS